MKRSVKMALATGTVAVVGGLFLAGSSFADRGFGLMGGPMGGPMGGMGGFGGMRQEMLKNVDTDNDGAVSQAEIDAAVDGRFAQFDADKNGSLSLQEFEALWAEMTRPIAVRAFQHLDPDGDATVSKSELDSRFGEIVARFDSNDDGKLSREDHRQRHRMHRWSDDDGPRFGPGPRGRWQNDDDGEAAE